MVFLRPWPAAAVVASASAQRKTSMLTWTSMQHFLMEPRKPVFPELKVGWLDLCSLCWDLSFSYLRCEMQQNNFFALIKPFLLSPLSLLSVWGNERILNLEQDDDLPCRYSPTHPCWFTTNWFPEINFAVPSCKNHKAAKMLTVESQTCRTSVHCCGVQ